MPWVWEQAARAVAGTPYAAALAATAASCAALGTCGGGDIPALVAGIVCSGGGLSRVWPLGASAALVLLGPGRWSFDAGIVAGLLGRSGTADEASDPISFAGAVVPIRITSDN
jgi:hypothetical protein